MKLWPAHRRILLATGWLSFVEAHIDVLRYYPWPAFATESGPAWGLAMYLTGQRVAHIALEGRSDRDVVATIVHEAAHLAGLHEIGRMHDQRYAEAITAQFLAAFDALQRKNPRKSDDGDRSHCVIELRIEFVPFALERNPR
jgi:hypothetical protein